MAPSTTEQRESVFDHTGDELAEYIAWHFDTFGVPPMAGGAPDDDDDGDDDDGDQDADDDGDGSEADGDQDDDDAEGDDDTDWKTRSRQNERRAKKERAAAKKAQDELAKLRKGSQSEQEKAIAKARDEAREEARAEAQKELRSTRLEASVTRLSTDFADPEDALVQIERGIAKGDFDEDDIFDDDGKINADGVKAALKDILKRKPHLKGDAKGARFKGGSDARKGAGGVKGDEDKSVKDHLKDITRHKQ